MSLRITFELSEKDLRHFRKIMREAQSAAKDAEPKAITGAAKGLLDEVRSGDSVPAFIGERLEKLEVMITMVHDDEWALPPPERQRVLSALAYFSNPEDLIPDSIPGLGFLDDAIMVELVVRELRHEIDAYVDFCKHRDAYKSHGKAGMNREEYLDTKRQALHSRMRRRRRRDRSGSSRSSRRPVRVGLFG